MDGEIRSALFLASFDFLRHVGCENSYEMQAIPQYLGAGTGTGWRRPTGCLNCRSFPAKEPLFIGLFGEKRPIKIRPPVNLATTGGLLPIFCLIYIYIYIVLYIYIYITYILAFVKVIEES